MTLGVSPWRLVTVLLMTQETVFSEARAFDIATAKLLREYFVISSNVFFHAGPISSGFVNKYGCRKVTIAGTVIAGGKLI